MSKAKLVAQDLGKSFRTYGSEWSRFASWCGVPVSPQEETWVLRHISFSVSEGEAIGVVGQNGAGKSTLLKLITGTLQPSEGKVQVDGRVAAILELGMGFNQDLPGRQNAILSAGLMGYQRADIIAALPDIEAFAEIDEYFNQPVRTYSSGMQLRLAFSIVTAFRPDALIVDEALSVGDAYFQHKSFDRIKRFQKQGTALLIVSHDKAAIQNICDKALFLEKGSLVKEGDPEEVMDFYNAIIAAKENNKINIRPHSSGRKQTVSGTGEASVESITLHSSEGEAVEFVGVGMGVTLRIRVRAHKAVPRLVLGYMIKDRLGQSVFGTNTHHTEQAIEDMEAGSVAEFTIGFQVNLGPGSYSISTALVSGDTHLVNNYEWKDLALIFNVVNLKEKFFIGSTWVPPKIEIRQP